MKKSISDFFLNLILSPFIWLLSACGPLGDPVDETISKNHYYSKNKKDVIFSSSGNWFSIGKTNLGVDIESFQVLSPNFGKDKNKIYYKRFPITDDQIDLSSFKGSSREWMWNIGVDKNTVFSFDEYKKNKINLILDADPAHFIMTDASWGKDNTNHFYKNSKVNVDYNSFRQINDRFSVDKNNSYYTSNNTLISFLSDIKTLRKIDYQLAKDDYNIYFYTSHYRGKKINALFPIPYEDFKLVDLLDKHYIKVDDKIYYLGIQLVKAHSESFEVMFQTYAKDDKNVYYEGDIINGADAKTFRFRNGNFLDKNNQYRNGKVLDLSKE